MKPSILTSLSIAPIILLTVNIAFGQDIHYTQLDAEQLSLNPAFTGMFDGGLRVSAMARSQWYSYDGGGYQTLGGSVDLPVFTTKHGDYLGAGLQCIKFMDDAFSLGGTPNRYDLTTVGSIAYHKFFGSSDSIKRHNCELSAGIQVGYADDKIDVYYHAPSYVPYTSSYSYASPHSQYYMVNTGVSFSQSVSTRFNYVAGVSGYNLNQPEDAFDREQNGRTGQERRFTLVLGANWIISHRLTLRPAIIYQTSSEEKNLIAGNEFHFITSKHLTGNRRPPVAVFAGVYYNTGDIMTYNAGVELSSFRIGVGHIDPTRTFEGGGYQIEARYILQGNGSAKRNVPCNRF